MLKSYFYLARNVRELTSILSGATIFDIYSQEKDILFLDLELKDNRKLTLKISTDAQLPYLLLKDNHHKSKKNFINFCTENLPANIELLLIATNDRIINIKTNRFDIIFLLRGASTNIFFLTRDKSVLSFKKSTEEKTRTIVNEALALNYDLTGETLLQQISEFNKIEILRKNFPQINKDILREYQVRANKDNDLALLEVLVKEILFGKISLMLSNNDYSIQLQPSNWAYDKSIILERVIFDSFQEALNEAINFHYRFANFSRGKKIIQKFLETEIQFLSNKINNLRGRIDAGSKENEYRKIAQLILSNLHKIKKGMNEVILFDYDENKELQIKLDSKLPPNKLADKYFEKARDEKIDFEKSKELLSKAIARYEERKKDLEELSVAESVKDLLILKRRLKLSDNKKKKIKVEDDIKYRRFLIDSKYLVYVGKDSASNDKLTLHFAKQNDYWFHARGLPGSHVVLRVENSKEVIPKSVLKKAASIAGFFSKGKTAKLVPVSYTFRKFVHKKKGMAPGKVLLSKENVLIVPPEIPKNCEENYD